MLAYGRLAHRGAVAAQPVLRRDTLVGNDSGNPTTGVPTIVHTEFQQKEPADDIKEFLANLESVLRTNRTVHAKLGKSPFANVTGNGVAVNQFVFVAKEDAPASTATCATKRDLAENVGPFFAGSFTPQHVNDGTTLETDNELFRGEVDKIIGHAQVNGDMAVYDTADDAMYWPSTRSNPRDPLVQAIYEGPSSTAVLNGANHCRIEVFSGTVS
jgi:hypothetical protein